MTPTEIRTALETLARYARHLDTCESKRGKDCSCGLPAALALLSALPGETAPDGEVCTLCEGPVVDTIDHQACVVGRYDVPVCGVCVGEIRSLPEPAGDTGPAPPRALVEVVREWQQAYADVGVADTDTAVDAQRKLDRCWAAAEAVRAYPLPAPEAPETPR